MTISIRRLRWYLRFWALKRFVRRLLQGKVKGFMFKYSEDCIVPQHSRLGAVGVDSWSDMLNAVAVVLTENNVSFNNVESIKVTHGFVNISWWGDLRRR